MFPGSVWTSPSSIRLLFKDDFFDSWNTGIKACVRLKLADAVTVIGFAEETFGAYGCGAVAVRKSSH